MPKEALESIGKEIKANVSNELRSLATHCKYLSFTHGKKNMPHLLLS
jgi:hypothetical protein